MSVFTNCLYKLKQQIYLLCAFICYILYALWLLHRQADHIIAKNKRESFVRQNCPCENRSHNFIQQIELILRDGLISPISSYTVVKSSQNVSKLSGRGYTELAVFHVGD